MSADIINEITIQPASLALFTSAELAQNIVLTDSRSQPLKVLAVRSSHQCLKGELVSQEGGTIRLRVVATGAFPPGRHDETIALYTNDALYAHLAVPVTVVKEQRRRVMAIPEAVTFPPDQAAGPVMVRLRCPTGEAIAIDKVEASDPAIGCRWAAGADGWATLRVHLDQSKLKAGSLDGQLTVFFRRPAGECLVIVVRVEGSGVREEK